MEYNQIQIGKVRDIDYKKGVGEIVTEHNNFLFTIEDITSTEKLSVGDVVRFRAEIVHDVPRAHFVKKADLENS